MGTADRQVGWHKFCLCLRASFILLLHVYCCRHVKGLVELSPSAVAPVCQAGEQLELTCNVTGNFLRWKLSVILENGSPSPLRFDVISEGQEGGPPPLMVNSTTFTALRLDITPLMSRMIISSVREGLNGVQVTCEDATSKSTAVTTIQIIGGAGDPLISNLSIQSHSERLNSEGILLLLEWTVSLSQLYYQRLLKNASINVVPDPEEIIAYPGNMSAQLTLLFNRQYNVTVTQPGVCGQPNQTEFILLNYTMCPNPMELVYMNVEIEGYKIPAQVGDTVTFTCRVGSVRTGPSSSICKENGEWDPDPGEVNCTESESVVETNSDITSQSSNGFEGGSSEAVKVSIGIVFGALAAVFVAVVVVIILAMFLKSKGHFKRQTRKPNSGYALNINQHEALGDSNNQNHKAEEAKETVILYADIGLGSFPKQQTTQKSTLLELDDSHVEYALLNHSVHSDKGSTLKVSTTVKTNESDEKCPPVNLDNLLIQLRSQVGPKWYQFGEAAEIEKEALDEIVEQCQTPEQCIVELFDHWLRSSAESLTWKTVADVLKAINLTELACDIEKVYTTGTLPIEVDMNRMPDLDLKEEEPPPPLPARSENLYIDAASHALDSGSQGSKAPPLPPPPFNNETSAPVLPPKPAHMKFAAWSNSLRNGD